MLKFYVANYSAFMHPQNEYVCFTLYDRDFEESITQYFFFQSLIDWHSDGCKNSCCMYNQCVPCERFQDIIEKYDDKWKNITGTNSLSNVTGKELFITCELLDAEFAKIRYDVGGEGYNKAKQTFNSLIPPQ